MNQKYTAEYFDSFKSSCLVHPELMQTWHDWGMDQSKRYWDLMESLEAGPDSGGVVNF